MSTLGSIPREALRARLEAMDDPSSRTRTKIYPCSYGGSGAVQLQDRPASVVMDSFAGATWSPIESACRAHQQASEAAMRTTLRGSLALGAVGLTSLMGMAAGVVPGPVGLVVGGLSLAGCVLVAARYEQHEDAARDDARLLGEMRKAGEALLAGG